MKKRFIQLGLFFATTVVFAQDIPQSQVASVVVNQFNIDFPKAKVEWYDFSFSGVKSAVLNYLNQCKMKNEEIIPKHIAASFQHAVVEAVVE